MMRLTLGRFDTIGSRAARVFDSTLHQCSRHAPRALRGLRHTECACYLGSAAPRFKGRGTQWVVRLLGWAVCMQAACVAAADLLKTWDGRHSIERIDVTVVYFVPRDRDPLPDWKDRVQYFCRRIERFHRREFGEQSVLATRIRPEPFRSAKATGELRAGNQDLIFFQTLREVDAALSFGTGERAGFPILLVLSDINWRDLEDFYRLRRVDGKLQFEGNYNGGRHFPGAESGGARSTYLADRGVGWGLVSADGWRVPYSGTDCVVYHEGVGHPIGLPHPEPANGSVMSLAQYRGWINESWIDDEQKKKLGWQPPQSVSNLKSRDLFSVFTAVPDPAVPKPGGAVFLRLTWPEGARIKSCRAAWQTELAGPWHERDAEPGPPPQRVVLARFDRPTPVSYRVRAELDDGQDVELWGYFQVRSSPDQWPLPRDTADDNPNTPPRWGEAVDLLALIDVERDAVSGEWQRTDNRLESNKQYGARIELPFQPPDEYLLTVIAEPLDEPNGLILGQRLGGRRFLVLLNFAQGENLPASALENIDGRNVNNNATTLRAALFQEGRPSAVAVAVRKESVTVSCVDREIIHWTGDPSRLSLSDYWKTPHDQALFLGAYDCRFRFHRVELVPITGTGETIPRKSP
ncbi:MAG: hypothetical protein HY000_29055 [Planctomycetes bacterium]|nr:hypothetical protein [Planctomycetota bacterium]